MANNENAIAGPNNHATRGEWNTGCANAPVNSVLKFPIIHDPTDRWAVVRTHFYEIQAGIHCQLQPFLGGKDTDHISIRIDHADWSDPDLIIDPMHLFRRCRR